MKRLISTFPKTSSNLSGISWIRGLKRPPKTLVICSLTFFLFSGLIIYDKKEKKRIIEKYCDRVKFLARQPMNPLDLPRKVMIYLSSPPGNDLWVSRTYFQEYIRPILQAAAVDYEIVEGNAEGDLQRRISQEIRQHRRGESHLNPEMLKVMENVRPGRNDSAIIIGRQTLKEYLSGVHEGWLGPLESPSASDSSKMLTNKSKDVSSIFSKKNQKSSLSANIVIPTLQYIPFLYVSGFFNMHIRIYRFLNRRFLAQFIASKTVDIILENQTCFWQDTDQSLGEEECLYWPKQYRTRTTSGVWTDNMMLDKRIMSHVRLYCSSRKVMNDMFS
ncbi:hypothetical protein PCANB_000381 [Pneumocystis canis]|nr:hypothetical protein PCANB_000381 [Pneumocystis canis]